MWYYASILPACEVEILLNGLAWVAQFLEFSTKEWDNPGCPKNTFFLLKQVVFHMANPDCHFSVVQDGPPFFCLKNAGVHVDRGIPTVIKLF
jgi:hypothetical protein